MSWENWTYSNPVQVVFAPGSIGGLAEHLHFRRVVLITSPGFTRRGLADRIRTALGDRLLTVLDDVKPNPDVVDIDAQAVIVRDLKPDCIVALGGGSCMDTAKALARLLTQPASVTLTAHFRDGAVLDDVAALPVVTIPTTSGTGSEVTPFGTVWDFGQRKKYSVTGRDLYSHMAVLDPELTLGLPAEVTVSSGLDAVSHALESAWNKRANPITLAFAAKSLQMSLPALSVLRQQPANIAARGAMMQASLLAGLAISQTRTALAHSISYPLTATFNLPHGIACSFTLPTLMRFNAAADDGRLADLVAAAGYESIDGFADALSTLFRTLDVAGIFSRYVSSRDDVMGLSGEMFTPGRADNNMRQLADGDIERVLGAALGELAV